MLHTIAREGVLFIFWCAKSAAYVRLRMPHWKKGCRQAGAGRRRGAGRKSFLKQPHITHVLFSLLLRTLLPRTISTHTAHATLSRHTYSMCAMLVMYTLHMFTPYMRHMPHAPHHSHWHHTRHASVYGCHALHQAMYKSAITPLLPHVHVHYCTRLRAHHSHTQVYHAHATLLSRHGNCYHVILRFFYVHKDTFITAIHTMPSVLLLSAILRLYIPHTSVTH